jgi:arabinofuranosyltransferase
VRLTTLPLVLLAVAIAALAAQSVLYPDCLSDDAFISFRYAHNLAQGDGLVFNPASANPVEGYTNFLWTLILAATTALGFDPERAARLLGLAAGMGAQIAAFYLTRTLLPRSPLAWALPSLLLASSSFFLVESIQGLETTLMAALVTAALARKASEMAGSAAGEPALPFSALLMGLAALTRPEGYLLFGVFLLADALQRFTGSRRPGGRDLLAPVFFALPVVPHLAFRLWTYGQWLPHTFHAKTGGGLDQVRRGIQYVASGWLTMLPWVLLALVGVALLLFRRPAAASRRAIMLTFAVWLTACLGVAVEGGDFKPTFRFLVWSLPLLAVLAITGATLLGQSLAERRSVVPATAMVVILVAGSLTWAAMGSHAARRFAHLRQADLARLRQAAEWFDSNLPPDALIATGPAGAIPYYTGRPTLDMWGINDAAIGRRIMPDMGTGTAGHEKGDGASVMERAPRIILFTEARFTAAPLPEKFLRQSYLYVSERELLDLPGFNERYEWRSVPLASATLNFYERLEDGDRTP